MQNEPYTVRKALNQAIYEEMLIDEHVIMLGEDIGIYGGAFGVSRGLLEKFGPERIIDTPISENSFTGMAIGAALMGLRPIVEIMFMDFMTLAMDQIVNHGAKIPFMYDNQLKVPLVIRLPSGGGKGYGASHSQCLESWFLSVPGVKVVSPYTPNQAKGLLKSAIRNDSLVLFIENKSLYNYESLLNEETDLIDISKAIIEKQGEDITIVSYSRMMHTAHEVYTILAGGNINAELINLISLKPLDITTIFESVKKTGRLVVIEEGNKIGGVGSEIVSSITEMWSGNSCLKVRRVGAQDIPIPSSRELENLVLPTTQKVIDVIEEVI